MSADHTSFIEVSAAPNTIATIKIRKNAIMLKINLYVKAIERVLSCSFCHSFHIFSFHRIKEEEFLK